MLQTDNADRRTCGQADRRRRVSSSVSGLVFCSFSGFSRSVRDVCGRAKMYSFWDVFNFSLKSLSVVVFCASSVSLSLCLPLSLSLAAAEGNLELATRAPLLPFASCVPPRCLSNGVSQITGNDNRATSSSLPASPLPTLLSCLPLQLLSINTHLHVLGAMASNEIKPFSERLQSEDSNWKL